MRRLVLVLAVVLALGAAAPVGAASTAITINRSSFSPSSVTVTEGDTVTWTNKDSQNHQVVADNGSFASPILKPGQKYTFVVGKTGFYRYHDALNPKVKGSITVKEAPVSLAVAVSEPIVSYGDTTMLSGTVSNGREGLTLTVYSQPYPQASYSQLTTVLTTAGGAWSLILKPS